MKKIWTQNRKDKSRFEIRLLAVLVTVVILGLSAATYTASGAERDDRLQSGQLRYFDPFDLTTFYLDMPESAPMTNIMSAPIANPPLIIMKSSTVIIPIRPTIRTPFRPPLVPNL
jgi:hypothetical protein